MNAHEIADAILTWANWPGFSGEHCYNPDCKVSMNVFGRGPGYSCPRCGEYNCQSWSHVWIPHETPNYGPPLHVIQLGGRLAHRRSEAARKYAVGQTIRVDLHWDTWMSRPKIAIGRISGIPEHPYPGLRAYYVTMDGKERYVPERAIKASWERNPLFDG